MSHLPLPASPRALRVDWNQWLTDAGVAKPNALSRRLSLDHRGHSAGQTQTICVGLGGCLSTPKSPYLQIRPIGWILLKHHHHMQIRKSASVLPASGMVEDSDEQDPVPTTKQLMAP